jgi:hypothetical protein
MTGKKKNTKKHWSVVDWECFERLGCVFLLPKFGSKQVSSLYTKKGISVSLLPSFQDKQVANCKRGREAVIHPFILLREEGEATWFFVEKMEIVAGSKASTSCSMRLISVVHSSSLAKSGIIR